MLTRVKPGAYEGFHRGVYYTVRKTTMMHHDGDRTGWAYGLPGFISTLYATKEAAEAAAIERIEEAGT